MTETELDPNAQEGANWHPDLHDGDDADGEPFRYELPEDEDDGDEWMDSPESDTDRAQRLHTTALHLRWVGDDRPYFTGEELPTVEDDEVVEWYDSLPPEQQASLKEEKEYLEAERERTETAARDTLTNLEDSAPSLLEGRLPKELEELLRGSEYALAVRQIGEQTAEDAQAAARLSGGVSAAEQGLTQSFNVVSHEDPDFAASTMVMGYYGPGKGGKYVVVLPVGAGEGTIRGRAMSRHADLTELAGRHDGSSAIEPKYCAGFIDNNGVFFPNKSFMKPDAETVDFGVEAHEKDEWM